MIPPGAAHTRTLVCDLSPIRGVTSFRSLRERPHGLSTPGSTIDDREEPANVRTASERREELKAVYEEARDCTRCPLHVTRTNVVFGAGNADADLMFIGEAPGAHEDRMGLPFVGQAGQLPGQLVGGIGMERGEAWVCDVLKWRPPRNRGPHPHG